MLEKALLVVALVSDDPDIEWKMRHAISGVLGAGGEAVTVCAPLLDVGAPLAQHLDHVLGGDRVLGLHLPVLEAATIPDARA